MLLKRYVAWSNFNGSAITGKTQDTAEFSLCSTFMSKGSSSYISLVISRHSERQQISFMLTSLYK